MNLVAANVSSLIFGRRSEPTHVGCYEGSFMVIMRFKRKWKLPMNRSSESGRGLPHSKTQAEVHVLPGFREVLDCASPLALWLPLQKRVHGTDGHPILEVKLSMNTR